MSNDTRNGKHHDDDVAFIQSLAELLNASELSELSVKREYGEHDRLTISLSKHGRQLAYAAAPAAVAPMPGGVAVPAPAAAAQTRPTPTIPMATAASRPPPRWCSAPCCRAYQRIGRFHQRQYNGKSTV